MLKEAELEVLLPEWPTAMRRLGTWSGTLFHCKDKARAVEAALPPCCHLSLPWLIGKAVSVNEHRAPIRQFAALFRTSAFEVSG